MGELQEALDAIKWGTDYLLNAHVEPKKFVAMYGSSEVRPGIVQWELSHPLFECEVAVPSGALYCLHTVLWPFYKAYSIATSRRLCCMGYTIAMPRIMKMASRYTAYSGPPE